jgi:hypothetical protein
MEKFMNSHFRKKYERKKLKKLAEKGANWCGGSYYDEDKKRYIRFWKSSGKKSLWATAKRTARKRIRLYLKRHNIYTKKADDLWWNVW